MVEYKDSKIGRKLKKKEKKTKLKKNKPKMSNTKDEIKSYLDELGIDYKTSMTKKELLKLIK